MPNTAGRKRRRVEVAHPASRPGDYPDWQIPRPADETDAKRLLHCRAPCGLFISIDNGGKRNHWSFLYQGNPCTDPAIYVKQGCLDISGSIYDAF